MTAPSLASLTGAPAAGWAEGPLGVAQAADRAIARETAVRARALAEFAASRPASVDRAQGEPGAMSAERWLARPEVLRPVSEWATQEVVLALSVSSETAERLLEQALLLVHRLPATLAALESGTLHVGHLWSMLDKVAPIADQDVRTEIERAVVAFAAGRVTTPAQLGAKIRRLLLACGARDAGRELARALRERGVSLRPDRADGMATVTTVMTMPEARALTQALHRLADSIRDDPDEGAPRTRGQKMVDVLLDLVLRPGGSELPPVQVLLTLVAPVQTALGGDAPGEVDGQVIPAEMVRDLLRGLAGLRPSTDTAAGAPGGPGTTPWQELEQQELAEWWAEMERRVLADELPPGPEPVPDDVLLAQAERTAQADGALPADLTTTGAPDGTRGDAPPGPTAEPRTPDEPAPDRPPPDERRPEGPPSEARPPDGPPPCAETWWSAACRATADAGEAALAADRALGRASRLLRTARAADLADESAWRGSPDGRVDASGTAVDALGVASAARREELAALLSATGGGVLAERPRIALVDALSGTFLALTDLPELRRAGTCGSTACRRRPAECTHDLSSRPGLQPPGPTDGYRPSRELDRWVRARDRRCRFPGCRRRVPRAGELDHQVRYPEGPTSATNLAGFCTGHHRGKHQAPGWSHALAPDGVLTVTAPTGMVATSAPPPY